jgi:hypothetical protein
MAVRNTSSGVTTTAVEPDDNNAELFLEQTESRIYEDGEVASRTWLRALV